LKVVVVFNTSPNICQVKSVQQFVELTVYAFNFLHTIKAQSRLGAGNFVSKMHLIFVVHKYTFQGMANTDKFCSRLGS
jgi:hypothetical protein